MSNSEAIYYNGVEVIVTLGHDQESSQWSASFYLSIDHKSYVSDELYCVPGLHPSREQALEAAKDHLKKVVDAKGLKVSDA